jgi:hypothetical protein
VRVEPGKLHGLFKRSDRLSRATKVGLLISVYTVRHLKVLSVTKFNLYLSVGLKNVFLPKTLENKILISHFAACGLVQTVPGSIQTVSHGVVLRARNEIHCSC